MHELLKDYPPVLSVEQVAEILGVGKQLVRKSIASNELGAIKLGRLYKIPKTALIEFLNNTLNYGKGA